MQTFQSENQPGDVRLNKYISDAGVCSRREADRLITEGRVQIDGKMATLGSRVASGMQVCVDGKEIAPEEEMILLAVNKPRGIVCTTDTRWGDRTIYDLMNYPKRIFSIGRLDKESEGLLLMTNNGDILNKIMRAGNYHEKEYLVTIDKPVTEAFLKKMSGGLYLKELKVRTRPCKVSSVGEFTFQIILTQGLNRQIRRMCAACGCQVLSLKRVRIMNIELGSLEPGVYRKVTKEEYAVLLEALKDSSNPGEHRKHMSSFKNPKRENTFFSEAREPERNSREKMEKFQKTAVKRNGRTENDKTRNNKNRNNKNRKKEGNRGDD